MQPARVRLQNAQHSPKAVGTSTEEKQQHWIPSTLTRSQDQPSPQATQVQDVVRGCQNQAALMRKSTGLTQFFPADPPPQDFREATTEQRPLPLVGSTGFWLCVFPISRIGFTGSFFTFFIYFFFKALKLFSEKRLQLQSFLK